MGKIIVGRVLSFILFFSAFPCGGFSVGDGDGKRYGVTVYSANFLREDADFTAELGNQLLMGTPVEILQDSSYWRKVTSPDPYTAWCVDMSLAEMTGEQLRQYISAPKLICTAKYSAIYEEPSLKSPVVGDFVMGDIVIDKKKTRGRFRRVATASGTEGYVLKKDVSDFRKWAASRNPSAENIIAVAKDFLGVPYMWGGTSIKGVDCSGLTRMVWFMNGVLLPRNASEQAFVGTEIPVDASASLPERVADLLPGDMIFFGTKGCGDERDSISHVGIYLGDGKFIHASRVVRISSLLPDAPDFYDLSHKFIRAVRIAGDGNDTGTVIITDSPAYFND